MTDRRGPNARWEARDIFGLICMGAFVVAALAGLGFAIWSALR